MKYIVVKSNSLQNLSTDVSSMMADGWRCQGGVLIVPCMDSNGRKWRSDYTPARDFMQAMTTCGGDEIVD